MRIGAIVQARMSSRRLPGKVLRSVDGKPLMAFLLERLRTAKGLDSILLATSNDPSDDVLERFCEERAVRCHRGDLEDVARRLQQASREGNLGAFVRVNGDSPLLDPGLIERGVELYREGDLDIVTNVCPRSFPRGQSVEIVRCATFDSVVAEMVQKEEREHVTTPFYARPDRFRLKNFAADQDWSEISMAVDTEEDLEVFTAVVAEMDRPHCEYGVAALVPLYRLCRGGR
jgi:spore coat polysaccharide biosynthesis protein SpsF (cytidylyltransferase family)